MSDFILPDMHSQTYFDEDLIDLLYYLYIVQNGWKGVKNTIYVSEKSSKRLGQKKKSVTGIYHFS